MTPFLILARAAIIGWTRLAVFPLEITFNAVEGALKRQGVEPVSEKPPRRRSPRTPSEATAGNSLFSAWESADKS